MTKQERAKELREMATAAMNGLLASGKYVNHDFELLADLALEHAAALYYQLKTMDTGELLNPPEGVGDEN